MTALLALALAAAPPTIDAKFEHRDAAEVLRFLGGFTHRKVVQYGCAGRKVSFSVDKADRRQLVDAAAKALDATIKDDGKFLVAACPLTLRDERAMAMLRWLSVRFQQPIGSDGACVNRRVTVEFRSGESK